MPIRCLDCGTENEDDALVCINCKFKFLDLVLDKEEIFFIFKKDANSLRENRFIENKGGIAATVNISSDLPKVIITPKSVDLEPKKRARIAVNLNIVDLNPDLPLHGSLNISVKDRPGYSKSVPIFFGRPPEPEIEPNEAQLGDVFEGKLVEIPFSVRNKYTGTLKFLGYKGDLIGEKRFESPITISDKSELVMIPIDLSRAKPGGLRTQITFLFGDGVSDAVAYASANVLEGPRLEGEISWYSMKPGNSPDDEYRYPENPISVKLDNSTRGPIKIDLGTIPQHVRSRRISLRLSNPSMQDYNVSMEIRDATSGVSAGFGEEGWQRVDMAMPSGQTYNGFIQAAAKGCGQQSLWVKFSYDRQEYGLPELEIAISMNVTEIKNSKKYFGIDLGTTNSCISYHDGLKPSAILVDSIIGTREHVDGIGVIPYIYSFCCFPDQNKAEEYYVGRYAEEATTRPASIGVKSIKMRLGTGWSISVGGKIFYARDIAGIILKELIARARDELGVQPCNAIITVPANSSLRKIEDVTEAYKQAGINVPSENIIYEPEAATYYYLLGTVEGNQRLESLGTKTLHILTFDFGGGTLDISIVRVRKTTTDEGEKIEIKILKSIARFLGGDDMDWGLRGLAVDKCVADSKVSIDERDLYKERMSKLNPADIKRYSIMSARLDLMRSCENTKKTFSDPKKDDSDIQFITHKGPHVAKITRTEHDDVCKSVIINEAKKFIEQVIQSVRMNKEDIDLILMAGGSSFLIPVQEMIHGMFSKERVEFLREAAKTSVSMGAVMYAYEKNSTNSIYEFSKVEPQTDVRIGYMSSTVTGMGFMEIFPEATPADSKSEQKQKKMPPSGVYTLVLAKNRGNSDRWTGNPELEKLMEQRFDTAKAGENITEWFELDKVGNLVWCIQHSGGTNKTTIEILDIQLPGGDDLGY